MGYTRACASSHVHGACVAWHAHAGDGLIEKKEFRAALPELGFASVSHADFEELFNQFDADGSGAIAVRERTRSTNPHPNAPPHPNPHPHPDPRSNPTQPTLQ